MEMETRSHLSEIRAKGDDKKKKLVGYAAVFDRRSLDLGGFVEVIERGAFAESLNDGVDVRALIDHRGIAIARTGNGTLTLEEDDIGLRVEIDTPDTTAGNDIYTSVQRGDVDQMSFGFTVRNGGDTWEEDDEGMLVRTLTGVNLLETSIVTFPAYPDTTIANRSVQQYREKQGKQLSLANAAKRRRQSQILKLKERGLI